METTVWQLQPCAGCCAGVLPLLLTAVVSSLTWSWSETRCSRQLAALLPLASFLWPGFRCWQSVSGKGLGTGRVVVSAGRTALGRAIVPAGARAAREPRPGHGVNPRFSLPILWTQSPQRKPFQIDRVSKTQFLVRGSLFSPIGAPFSAQHSASWYLRALPWATRSRGESLPSHFGKSS